MDLEKLIIDRIKPKIVDLELDKYPQLLEFVNNLLYTFNDLVSDEPLSDPQTIFSAMLFGYLIKLSNLHKRITFVDNDNFKKQLGVLDALHMEVAGLFQEVSK